MASSYRLIISLLFPCLFQFFSVNGQIADAHDLYKPQLMPPKGHTASVKNTQISPDGKHILTVSYDQTAKVWDGISGKLLYDLDGHKAGIRHAHLSPDGKRIVTASNDRTAKVWNVLTGEVLVTMTGDTNSLRFAQFSPDGLRIVTVSEDKTAKVWDAITGKMLNELIGHTHSLNTAHYTTDGKRIITTGKKSVRVWDAINGEELLRLPDCHLWSSEFSPSGKLIVTSMWDKSIKVWDLTSGEELFALVGHVDRLNSISFSPDEKRIVTASTDQTAKVWDAQTGELILDLVHHKGIVDTIKFDPVYFTETVPERSVTSAHYSPDGKQIITSCVDRITSIWDAQTGKKLFDLNGHNTNALFTEKSKRIITNSDNAAVKIWDAMSGEELLTLTGHTSSIYFAPFSPDGKHLFAYSWRQPVNVWDLSKGKPLHKLSSDVPFGPIPFHYSPDGKYAVTLSWHQDPRLWDVKTGKEIRTLTGHTNTVDFVQFSPDGKKIITASKDQSVKVWDASTGEILLNFSNIIGCHSAQFSPDNKSILTLSKHEDSNNGHPDIITLWDAVSGEVLLILKGYMAQFSPDGKYFVTKERNQPVKVWDANSRRELLTTTSDIKEISLIDFSPDGSKIVVVDRHKVFSEGLNDLYILDVISGQLLHVLVGHTDGINYVHFSPNGNQIVTASKDRTAKVWDVATGNLLLNLIGHNSSVNFAQFNPEGEVIVSTSSDGFMKFWSTRTGKELLTLIPVDLTDWVVLHPSGLFDASPKAMEWMYYLIGQEVIELDQLKERYYEPGLYEKVMAGESLRDVEDFKHVTMYPEIESFIEKHELWIHLKERNGGIGKVSLFVNNKEVIPDANVNRDTMLNIDLTQFDKYFLSDKVNTISFRAYNEAGWLKSSAMSHSYTPDFTNQRGRDGGNLLRLNKAHDPHLYAVVIGTSDYVGDDLDLQFADKDSKDMASAIEQSSRLLFGTDKVHVDWFTSKGLPGSKLGSKSHIKTAFDSIAIRAQAEDILLVYFSGHGVTHGSSENEQFYYLTKDVYSGDLTDPQIRASYTISTDEITQWINSIAAQKQVMILDACSSGKVVENLLAVRNVPSSQIRALDRMKDRTGMFVLAGSAADKVSYEASQFGQGLLTYSLLLGMSGAALKDGQTVDVMNLFQYARDQVPEFANDLGGVQTPTLAFPADASSFDIGLVTDEVNIPLQQIKPLFTRSSFQEEESWHDIVEISKALDSYLVDAASGPLTRGIIFVDVDTYENAYSVKGRYHFEGDKLIVFGRLFKGNKKLAEFEVIEDKNQKDKIVEGILDKVVEIINQ